jgi:hypothetical protein
MRFLYIIIIGFILFSSCKNDKGAHSPLDKNSSVHKVKVKEVVQ